MNRRIGIGCQWLSGKRNGVSLLELIKVMFAPTSTPKAKRYITSIEEDQDFIKIYLKNVDMPLYYPKEASLQQLHQVISELFCPSEWHYYETDETRVQPDDVVVDCGAAEGLFSLLVANRCKKVYAVEPHPRFVEAMQHTFNGGSNIRIVPVALSDQESQLFLCDSGISSTVSSTEGGTPVKATTLDNLMADTQVTYIKADLEGYEMEMLKGARKTIQKYSPKIAITTYHNRNSASEITDYLKSLNPYYKIRLKGIEDVAGKPVMLHAWIDER
jgi:FkbM family methyltransferase